MSRLFMTVILIATVAFFWYFYSSKSVGYIYNPNTQSKEYLHNNSGELSLISYKSTDQLDKVFRILASSGIKIIIGPPTSAEGELILPYLKKYNMVAISATISSTKLLSSGYIYSFMPSNKFLIESISQFLKGLGIKKLLIISDPNNRAYSDEFLELHKTFPGVNIYYYNENSLQTIDITAFDGALMSIFSKEAATVVRFLKAKNPSINIIGTDSVMAEDFIHYAGKYAEGAYVIYSMDYLSNPEIELIKEVSNFISNHKFLSSDQFRRYIKKNVIVTPKGKFYFDIGSVHRPPKIFKVENGTFVEQKVF
ncbi:MAG: ABC transporter substrate-binding protein [Fervidobacterium sp.]